MTLKRAARAPEPSRAGARPEGGERREGGFRGGEGRDSYRREGGAGRGFGGEKKVAGEFKPEFRGGFGRGGPRDQ